VVNQKNKRGEDKMENIKHLLNLDKQRFITLGGLPGAGKSTIVTEFEKIGYIVVCPDRIRYRLAKAEKGNEDKFESELSNELRRYDMLSWSLAEKNVKKYIGEGKSVIFDATFNTTKSRRQILSWSREVKFPLIAIYVECPLDEALNRNLIRSTTEIGKDKDGNIVCGRYVPEFVIKNKWITQSLPTIQEGFTEVNIIHVLSKNRNINNVSKIINELKQSNNVKEKIYEWHESGFLKEIFPSLDACWNLDQENKNHNRLLHDHMIDAAIHLQKEDTTLFLAALLHDVGKLATKKKYGKMIIDTKEFKIGEKVEVVKLDPKGFVYAHKLDYKGEKSELTTIKHINIDSNAHYYEHNLVGAIIARREMIELGLDEYADDIYNYVLYHMDMPFVKVGGKKQIKKIIDKVGKKNIYAMIKLREADKSSSNGDKYFEEIHPHNIMLIDEVIKDMEEYKCRQRFLL
jgi:predicted kinase